MKNKEIFRRRRQEFMEQMQGGIAILMASPHATRNSDSHYKYRTCSYFYYLTGLKEQSAALILAPGTDKPFRLFVMPKDPEREIWDGKRFGVDMAKTEFGADFCAPIDEFEKHCREIIRKAGNVYYGIGLHPEHDRKVISWFSDFHPMPRAGEKPIAILRPQDALDKMRMHKNAEEVEIMRASAVNSSHAHRHAMAITKPGIFEYEVEAEIECAFKLGGAEDLAYSSIVAGGDNACILHYNTNRDKLHDGDLLLIDAGGELGLYASDITRTFPVNGKFTPAQKKIYEIVLNAQKAAIAMVKPGVKYHDIHHKAVDMLVEGLLGLGLLKGKKEEIVADRKNYVSFYPHNTGHWLGLDVHDAGIYFQPDGSSLPLAAGQVLTVEPGIYISKDRTDVPAEYRGIGIRIEDDVLVTANGFDVLTKDCPKEISEIEAIVGTKAKN